MFTSVHGGTVFLIWDGTGHFLCIANLIYVYAHSCSYPFPCRSWLARCRQSWAEHIRKGQEQRKVSDIADLESYAAGRRTRHLTKTLLGTVGFLTKPRWVRWPIWVMSILSYISLFIRQIVYRLSGLGNRMFPLWCIITKYIIGW